MGNIRGFINTERTKARYRDISERINDYREVSVDVPIESLIEEGARCMDCGTPFCHSLGCPLANLIPEWNDLVYRERWKDAWVRLELTNNFPEITGRLCPAPCEESCTLSINRSPVSIKQIERAIAEKAFNEGWVVPLPPLAETGKSIAIVGSGPAGLAAAQQLRRLGHSVTVFEKSEKPGGILMYGIPSFKLEKRILERRLNQLEEEGVVFETDVEVGEDISARYLRKKYDAILLSMGAGEPRDIKIPGRELKGITFAVEYLSNSTRKEKISATGKNVLIIGGGDTGSDCVGTALRQKASSITQVEILPRPVDWKKSYNPDWPFWPKKLRDSTSHEEAESLGILKREWSVMVKEFRAAENEERSREKEKRVGEAYLVRLDWRKKKNGNSFEPVEIPNSGFYVKADLVILAMGFLHTEHSRLIEELGIDMDERGNIKVGKNYQTSVPGIFAAGDSHTGASLVVRAINHGRLASSHINSFLR